jgi:tRNA pseudouridine55 synthase
VNVAIAQGHPADARTLMVGSGLVIVDKSAGMTSHDVVAQIRRLAATRRVGHAGTLDPMATGVLVLGVDKATRLLGHLALTEKEYAATIRLGQSTVTDDAEGDIVSLPGRKPSGPATALTEQRLRAELAAFTGQIEQVPPQVSAIKVKGRRAYHLTRSGAAPELAARTVTISRLVLTGRREAGDLLDIDVEVTCSTGTYVRAIARDLGAALGVGGHLTALRRTRVGPYRIGQARTIGQLAAAFEIIPIEQAARQVFPVVDLSADEARLVSHGVRLPALDVRRIQPPEGLDGANSRSAARPPTAAFGPDGALIALLAACEDGMQPTAVFVS